MKRLSEEIGQHCVRSIIQRKNYCVESHFIFRVARSDDNISTAGADGTQ